MEVQELQTSLERERMNHRNILLEVEQEWKLKNDALASEFSGETEGLKQDHAETLKRFEAEKSTLEIEIEELKSMLRERNCEDENMILRLKSENELCRVEFEQKFEEMAVTLKAAESEKKNCKKEIDALKQNLEALEAQIGENESSQVQSLMSSLQSEREKHRQELDETCAKMSSENEEIQRKMSSDFERQKNDLIRDFEGQMSQLNEVKTETERIKVEKNVIEVSLEQMKLEFSKLSETFAANEKAVQEEKSRAMVRILIRSHSISLSLDGS